MTAPNRKAFVEVQFNWVFVLIVGAIILIFFVSIVNSQKKQSDKNLAFDVLSNIDLILSSGLTVPKTGQIFDMPRLEFDSDCNSLTVFGVTRQFPDKIVFAPSKLKGLKLVVWSQDWNVPFKVTNFLYITTSDVRYIFVKPTGDASKVELLYNNTPNITKDLVTDLSGLVDKNNYKIRIVYFGSEIPTNPQLPSSSFITKMANEDVTAVLVNPTGKYVNFYKKNGNNFVQSGNNYYYLEDPSIYGAIFAENEEVYVCSMEKAFKRLYYVSKILSERETALKSAYGGSICQGLRADNQMNSIKTSAYNANVSKQDEFISIGTSESELIASNQNNLENSCPSIY